jgi:hypothetical protein
MERPNTAIAIIKDFCPTSGVEVEGYINQLESRLASVTEELIQVKEKLEKINQPEDSADPICPCDLLDESGCPPLRHCPALQDR